MDKGNDCMYKDDVNGKSDMIVVIMAIFIIFLFCCGFYIFSIRQDAEYEIRRELRELLQEEAQWINDKIAEDILLARAIGIGMDLGNRWEINTFTDLRVFAEERDYLRIGIADLDGEVITTDQKRFNISKDEGFKKCIETGAPFFSGPIKERTGLECKILVLYVPLVDDRGGVRRVVFFTRTMQNVRRHIVPDLYNGMAQCDIFDNDGNIISESLSDGIVKVTSRNIYQGLEEKNSGINGKAVEQVEKIREDLGYGNADVLKGVFQGKVRYLAYAPVHGVGNGWNLFCVVDEEFILQKSRSILLRTLYLCLAMVFLIFVATAYMFQMKARAQRGIAALAYTDQLTQIGNVNDFYRKARAILDQNPNNAYTVIVFDVNNFKYINETYGYEAGDQLLIAIADKIKHIFCEEEACARISNDHFVVLAKACERGESRFYEITETFINEQNQKTIKFPLSFSSGAYRIRDKNEEVYAMVDKAQLTLKSIKNSQQTNFAYYSERLLKTFMENNEMESLMHEALRRGEFKVYLQPKFDLTRLVPVGAEALVRWISMEKGFMPPDKFIPLFEKNGFVVKIDFYILEEVCKKIRTWIDEGREPLAISVNQSRIHMDDPLYVDKLFDLIQKYDIPPNLIELELTESMFFADSVKLISIMKKMRKIGFLISMDDFGSGYSSLNLLKEIPVDVLKLDKAFLDEMANSSKSRIIISQVVEMAKKLGMKVVCEGVETESQADFLKEINCDMAQGYLYAKPMPLEDFEAFVRVYFNPVKKKEIGP